MFSFFKKKKSSELSNYLFSVFQIQLGDESLYVKALTHRSISNETGGVSNERLEYLGDAVIDLIVSEYLFLRYPEKDEGFLTQLKARLVKREQLNRIAEKIKLEPWVRYQRSNVRYNSILGNTFEALVGAIYLDKGYQVTKECYVKNILENPSILDWEKIKKTNTDYKSQLLTYCQRNKITLDYRLLDEKVVDFQTQFTMAVVFNGELKEQATALSKRKAEQKAAQKVFESIVSN